MAKLSSTYIIASKNIEELEDCYHISIKDLIRRKKPLKRSSKKYMPLIIFNS